MAERDLFTFTEEGMRKLVDAYRAQQREMSNLKRSLAHFSTRRHQTVYIPATAVEEVALAEFRAHEAPLDEYPYPLPSDENEDNVFPAFIQAEPDFIDDSTAVGFTEQQAIDWADGYDFDAEPVFVYSLRQTYIPPNTESGDLLHRLLPIFKVNGKWYCDYIPRLRLSFSAEHESGGGGGGYVLPSESVTYNIVASVLSGGRIYEGVTSETYSPLQVDDTGVVTAWREMDCIVTLSTNFEFGGSSSATVATAVVTIAPEVASTANTGMLPNGTIYLNGLYDGSGSWLFHNNKLNSISVTGLVRFTAGDTLQFKLTNSSSSGVDLVGEDLFVTLTPIETNSW